MRTQYAPGLYFEAVVPAAEPSPLRSDIAGFVGRTRRGPVGAAVRVTGWREFQLLFGGLVADAHTPYAIRGYFENGGDVAHVVRLLGTTGAPATDDAVATAVWDVMSPDIVAAPWSHWNPQQGRFTASAFQIRATSPGIWANGLRVSARYRLRGTSGRAEVDLIVRAADERVEQLLDLDPCRIEQQVAALSVLIRLVRSTSLSPAIAAASAIDGPAILRWPDIVLSGGLDGEVSFSDYESGLQLLADEAEVALVAMPDLVSDVGPDQALDIQRAAVAQADALHDRLILIDLPCGRMDSVATQAWTDQFRSGDFGEECRTAAAYHPWIAVEDPLGGVANPLREVPPGGHVAGLISRYDRERGAHYTPANATLDSVIDVISSYSPTERAALNEAGVNVLRCVPAQGIQVWGGRTLFRNAVQRDTRWLFIAHRRLIHRLVRAIRRVAEPMVFDTNGPKLWLALTRAITTLLLETYRAGGLKGARPEEAFRVRCDASNNPPEEVELGRVLCEIDLAPAVPMEFITLRVALSAQGTLDVFEK